MLLLTLLLGHEGGRVPGDVGVAGVGRVARGDGGHGHRDLGPGAAHRETVHTVVVVSVTRLARRNCQDKKCVKTSLPMSSSYQKTCEILTSPLTLS